MEIVPSRTNDRALADFAQSIHANPNYAESYNDRGLLYFEVGKVGLAIADLTRASNIKPNAVTYLNLGNAQFANAHFPSDETDIAVRDSTQALQLMPANAHILARRGYALFADGQPDAAAADLSQAINLNPHASDPVLFLHIVRMQIGVDDSSEFRRHAQALNPTEWSAPLVAFFLNPHKNPDDGLRVASISQNIAQRCERNFFIAEWMLSVKPALAPGYFEVAARICPIAYYEGAVARVEIGRLRTTLIAALRLRALRALRSG